MHKLTINIFGGPGVGKSTVAAGVYYHLKLKGIKCELVTEYAKDCAWQGFRPEPHEAYDKQFKRLNVPFNMVDYIITDSPIFLCASYGVDVRRALVAHERFGPNRNYLLLWPENRTYEAAGRHEDADQARRQHKKVWESLTNNGIQFDLMRPDERGVNVIVEDIVRHAAGQLPEYQQQSR